MGEDDAGESDDELHKRWGHGDEHPLTESSIGETPDAIGVYDWHWRTGHGSMKTIVNMANGMVTGMVLKDIHEDLLRLDSCLSCAYAKRNAFRSK